MITDLKFAFRHFLKNPGFSIFAVLTLALGIGANTAIYSIVNAVLLSTLPVKDPKQLVFLTDPNEHGFYNGSGNSFGTHNGSGQASPNRKLLTYAEFQALRDDNNVFSGICLVNSAPNWRRAMVEEPGHTPQWEPILLVSGDYFSVLGIKALIGRTFGPEVDKVRDATPVAVISYEYWENRLGGDRGIIGRKLSIQDPRWLATQTGTIYDIIGVMPPNFSGETVGQSPTAWVPITMQREISPGVDLLTVEKDPLNKFMAYHVIGRLKAGISLQQAGASMNLAFHQYLESQVQAVPKDQQSKFLGQRLKLVSGSHGASTLRTGFAEPLVILMILVGLLLLIACANVANLLLAHAVNRRKEIAVRIAIGAKPARIFRQLLTESVLLSLTGGIVGTFLAQWGDSILLQLVGQPLAVQADTQILAFTLAVSIIVGIVFGTAPALQASRVDLNVFLKGTVDGSARATRLSLGKLLIIAQVSLSLVLLIIAGLFVHSFQKLATANLGYDNDHLLIMRIRLTNSTYKGEGVRQLYQTVGDRVRAIPGVRGVTFSRNGLFSGLDDTEQISIEGSASKSALDMDANLDKVAAGYFSTLGIPILKGREIGPDDSAAGQQYGVINQTMARYYFGDDSPLGQRISYGPPAGNLNFIVVGVCADAKYNALREKTPRRFYLPFDYPFGKNTDADFEIHAIAEPSALTPTIAKAMTQAFPSLFRGVYPLDSATAGTLGLDRLLTQLSGFFGVLATILASIGIYGIMSYGVARRTREIGIRMALGSSRLGILWIVLKDSLALVAIGVAIGIPAAVAGGKLIGSLFFGLTSADPPVLAAAAAMMFVVAAIAGCIPARRATRVNPVVALRAE